MEFERLLGIVRRRKRLWEMFKRLRECLKGCESIWKDARVFERLWECLKGCESVWKAVRVFERLWEYLKGCENVTRGPRIVVEAARLFAEGHKKDNRGRVSIIWIRGSKLNPRKMMELLYLIFMINLGLDPDLEPISILIQIWTWNQIRIWTWIRIQIRNVYFGSGSEQ
jgi:hypothetical protein